MLEVAESKPFARFERTDKRAFDRAFADGRTVAIAKDPEWARGNETFIGLGFDRTRVADPYQDGPSRRGERWFYWVAVPGTETPTSAAEWRWFEGEKSFSFSCTCQHRPGRFGTLAEAEVARDEHAATHEPKSEVAPTPELLEPPVVAPEFDPKLQPLAGIRWPQGVRRCALEGEVALFDVADPGELQGWQSETKDAPARPAMQGETEPGLGIQPKGRNRG